MYEDLRGKVVLLTGIGQTGDPTMWGNGAATAKVFACEAGAKVFGCDLHITAANHTKKRLEDEDGGGTCDVMAADVTNAAQVKGFVQACMEKHDMSSKSSPLQSEDIADSTFCLCFLLGRIDILVNNVGRSEPGGPAEIDEPTWDKQTDIHLKSVYLTCHEVLPIMEKQASGVIINISSVAGLRYIGKPQVAYAASKAAINQFTKTTAVLYARKGVRLNTVVPGLMHTPLIGYLAGKYAGGDLQGLIEKRNHQVPMGIMGDGFDVANTVAFLASEKARYIVGQKIVVDGGITSTTP